MTPFLEPSGSCLEPCLYFQLTLCWSIWKLYCSLQAYQQVLLHGEHSEINSYLSKSVTSYVEVGPRGCRPKAQLPMEAEVQIEVFKENRSYLPRTRNHRVHVPRAFPSQPPSSRLGSLFPWSLLAVECRRAREGAPEPQAPWSEVGPESFQRNG